MEKGDDNNMYLVKLMIKTATKTTFFLHEKSKHAIKLKTNSEVKLLFSEKSIFLISLAYIF